MTSPALRDSHPLKSRVGKLIEVPPGNHSVPPGFHRITHICFVGLDPVPMFQVNGFTDLIPASLLPDEVFCDDA